MITVAIATQSSEKVDGIKEAMSLYLYGNNEDVRYYSVKTESGVSEQPFEEETYQGAINRLESLKKQMPGMDYYVSCEAGIESAFGQYFNVQVVCIENNSNIFWGKSSGWSIPSQDIEIIRKTNLDTYLREKGISSIKELLGTPHSRSAAVAQATTLALASGKLRNS